MVNKSVSQSRHRRLLKFTLCLVAFLVLPTVFGLLSIVTNLRALQLSEAPPLLQGLPPFPAHDSAKQTAVVLASNYGTEITDFLSPFELLAASGELNVYILAPERRLSPLTSALHLHSGLEIIPHYSFAEYRQIIGGMPDLIVVPFFSGYNQARDGQLGSWIREHAGERTTVLTICGGTQVLADTGLLDGRRATTFHRFIPRFEDRYPHVQWVRGVRYVEDGRIISSSSLTAGIDATLLTLERVAGRDVAEAVARKLNYAHLRFLDKPNFEPPARFALAALQSALQWNWPSIGVILYEGVGELALAAVLDIYGVSASHPSTLAPVRTVIQSQHGVALVPRWDFSQAPHFDRLLVLGDDSTEVRVPQRGGGPQTRSPISVEYIDLNDGFAYDVILKDMAHRKSYALAAAAAVNLVYPVEPAELEGRAGAAQFVIRFLGLGLVGVSIVLWFDWLTRRRKTEARP